MKNVRVLIWLLAFVIALPVGLYAAEKATTLEGTLVDLNCYLKDNSLTGNDHMGVKGCGTACLKSGLPAGVLSKDHKVHVIIARAPALADHVGQEVRVTGAIHGEAISADKVEVRKAGKWEEVNIKSMM